MIIKGKVLGIKRLPEESGKEYFLLIIEGARPIKVCDMQVTWKASDDQNEPFAIAEGKLKGSDNLKPRKVLISGSGVEIKRLMSRIEYITTQ